MSVEVLGIIQLGLQLFGEIKVYVEGVSCAPKELEAVGEQLQAYKFLLDGISKFVNDSHLSDRELLENVSRTIAPVERRVRKIRDEVRKLSRFGGGDDSATNDPPQSGSAKMSRKQRFLYPFKRDKMKDLVVQLQQLNSCLSTSLHLYQMAYQVQASNEQHVALSRISTGLDEVLEIGRGSKREGQQTVLERSVPVQSITSDLSSTAINTPSSSIRSLRASLPETSSQETQVVTIDGCDCGAKKRRSRTRRSWGWLSYMAENTASVTHEAGCIWSSLPSDQIDRTVTVTLQSRDYYQYFSTAIAATYNSQVSILPLVRAFNLVDLDRSPAMQLIDLADDLDDLEWDDPKAEQKARMYWHNRLMELFRDKKVSPSDVDYRTNRSMLHYLPLPSKNSMTPYVRLTWQTFSKLNFRKDTMLCNGLAPWEYNFATSIPLDDNKLRSELLPWQVERWLEPDEIPESLMTTSARNGADEKCTRAFVLAKIMNERRELLENSNVGLLCQAIIMRSLPKALQLLDDDTSSWTEPYLGDDSGVCAMDLAIMWFPELINSFFDEDAKSATRLKGVTLPRPHPSRYSFLEVAINMGLRHGGTYGKATTQDYLAMVGFALEHDYPIYFHRVSEHLGEAEETVTEHLADRRRRLLELATRRLPKAKVQTPELFEPRFVDVQVEEILTALAEAERSIPEALQPRDPSDSTRLAGSVFEYAWHSEDLCDRLEELGFDPEGFIRNRCRVGPFPMAPLLSPLTWDCWRFLWLSQVVGESQTGVGNTLLYSDSDPVLQGGGYALTAKEKSQSIENGSLSSSGIQFAHAMAVYTSFCITPGGAYQLGNTSGFQLPSSDISKVAQPLLASEIEDDCDCACSISGCRPLTSFLKVLMSPRNAADVRKDFARFSRKVEYSLKVIETALGLSSWPQSVALQILRLYTFACLECRHTCCIDWVRDYVYGRRPCPLLDQEECDEIHHEDSEKLAALETLLSEFEMDFRSGECDFQEFMRTKWLPRMRMIIDEEKNRSLTAAEVEKLQDVGVTWCAPRADDLHDNDAASAVFVNLNDLDTDEERMSAVKNAIDRICA